MVGDTFAFGYGMTKRYSTEPRPEIVVAAAQYESLTRQQLHVARQEAIARQDWLAMQAITYVLTLRSEVK